MTNVSSITPPYSINAKFAKTPGKKHQEMETKRLVDLQSKNKDKIRKKPSYIVQTKNASNRILCSIKHVSSVAKASLRMNPKSKNKKRTNSKWSSLPVQVVDFRTTRRTSIASVVKNQWYFKFRWNLKGVQKLLKLPEENRTEWQSETANSAECI